MRIIDKNNDFYDYLQNVYRDDSVTFDRTDSFVLTKEEVCDYMPCCDELIGNKWCFCLLQVCNRFWLFLIEVTKSIKEYDTPTDYTAELLDTWNDYSKQRVLCNLGLMRFDWWEIGRYFRRGKGFANYDYDKTKFHEKSSILVDAINTKNFEVYRSIDCHTIFLDGWRADEEHRKIEKHIPLLKASGFAGCIDPLDIYLSFEEYFSLEKTASERIESVGLTDKEKIENHGFDTKISFRGKQRGG